MNLQQLSYAVQQSPLKAAIHVTTGERHLVSEQDGRIIVVSEVCRDGVWYSQSRKSWPSLAKFAESRIARTMQDFIWDSAPEEAEFKALLQNRFNDPLYVAGGLNPQILSGLGGIDPWRDWEGEWAPKDRPNLLLRLDHGPTIDSHAWHVAATISGRQLAIIGSTDFEVALATALARAYQRLPWYKRLAIGLFPWYRPL